MPEFTRKDRIEKILTFSIDERVLSKLENRFGMIMGIMIWWKVILNNHIQVPLNIPLFITSFSILEVHLGRLSPLPISITRHFFVYLPSCIYLVVVYRAWATLTWSCQLNIYIHSPPTVLLSSQPLFYPLLPQCNGDIHIILSESFQSQTS